MSKLFKDSLQNDVFWKGFGAWPKKISSPPNFLAYAEAMNKEAFPPCFSVSRYKEERIPPLGFTVI